MRYNVCGLDWCNMLGVMEDMLQYREYMAQALELARKGAGWVDPNPLVGAVVVPVARFSPPDTMTGIVARMRSVWRSTMPTRTASI